MSKLDSCEHCGGESTFKGAGNNAATFKYAVACTQCGISTLPLNIDKALEGRGCDKWIAQGDPDEGVYECSACGNLFILLDGTPKENNYNYCPHCGRRLEGEE